MTGSRAERSSRRWGSQSALVDDDEARRRLVAASIRCIVRRGSAAIRVEEVASEAGVSRSTVYRYFASRDELILGVLLSRIESGMDRLVRSLARPGDAEQSIEDLIIGAIGMVAGDEVNEGLYSEASRPTVTLLELTSPVIVDGIYRHIGPLLERWRDEGQLRLGLDLYETARWLNAVAVILLTPPWSDRSPGNQRKFLQQYVVPSLINHP